MSQRAVFEGARTHVRNSFLIENRAVEKGFYQKMLVTDRYKLVAYMDQDYGELYDRKNDPHQYDNLWGSAAHRELKHSMLAQLCGHTNPDKEGIQELLGLMTRQVRSEEPVLPRTSYS